MNTRRWFQVGMQTSRISFVHVYKHRTLINKCSIPNVQHGKYHLTRNGRPRAYTNAMERSCKRRLIIQVGKETWTMTNVRAVGSAGPQSDPARRARVSWYLNLYSCNIPLSVWKHSKKQNGRRLYISARRIIKLASTGQK